MWSRVGKKRAYGVVNAVQIARTKIYSSSNAQCNLDLADNYYNVTMFVKNIYIKN